VAVRLRLGALASCWWESGCVDSVSSSGGGNRASTVMLWKPWKDRRHMVQTKKEIFRLPISHRVSFTHLSVGSAVVASPTERRRLSAVFDSKVELQKRLPNSRLRVSSSCYGSPPEYCRPIGSRGWYKMTGPSSSPSGIRQNLIVREGRILKDYLASCDSAGAGCKQLR